MVKGKIIASCSGAVEKKFDPLNRPDEWSTIKTFWGDDEYSTDCKKVISMAKKMRKKYPNENTHHVAVRVHIYKED